MELKLKGKSAIVTGATRGIGFAIAESLAKEGVNIGFCARNKDEVSKTKNHLKQFAIEVVGDIVDVSKATLFANWINQTATNFGTLDILVLNAAAMVSENTKKDWYANFEVDVMGAVTATKTAMPFLESAAQASGDASIIMISSISALETQSINSYGPCKSALIHLAKSVAKEFGKSLIRSNSISPGPIYFKNGYWDDYKKEDPQGFKKVLHKIPLGRLGTPQDIANAVLFLASPASSFISGANLIIDGAYTSRVNF